MAIDCSSTWARRCNGGNPTEIAGGHGEWVQILGGLLVGGSVHVVAHPPRQSTVQMFVSGIAAYRDVKIGTRRPESSNRVSQDMMYTVVELRQA
jgi:hypothetical protein